MKIFLNLFFVVACFLSPLCFGVALSVDPDPGGSGPAAFLQTDDVLVMSATPDDAVAVVEGFGFSPDSWLAKAVYWLFVVIGFSTTFVRAAVFLTNVTPNTKDDVYAASAKRYLSVVLGLIDKYMALGLPARQARTS